MPSGSGSGSGSGVGGRAAQAQDAIPLPTDKEGWLTKKAVKTLSKLNWKRRYVTLNATVCSIAYSKCAGGKPIRVLQLDASSSARRTMEHTKPGEFVVQTTTPGAEWIFFACADDESSADDWVAAVRGILRVLRKGAPEPRAPGTAAAAAADADAGAGAGAPARARPGAADRAVSLRDLPPPAAGAPGVLPLPPAPNRMPPAGPAARAPPPVAAGGAGIMTVVRHAEGTF
jgi:hypothetical protein